MCENYEIPPPTDADYPEEAMDGGIDLNPEHWPQQGRKYDIGKLRFDLIPPGPLHALAFVYTIGAAKYSDRNWEKGIAFGRVFAAMQRHAWAWWEGEEVDQEDGHHHLAAVAWCAFALLEYLDTHLELDDRPGSLL